jgi:hypothetical protein
MKFKYWRLWARSKPWRLQWFVYILLLRPFAETLYFLKETSPLASPLYWIGVITPLFALLAIINYKPQKTKIDRIFGVMSTLILASAIMTYPVSTSAVLFINMFLKLTYVVYIYYFLRIFIQSRIDLIGILTTILYSSIFPLFILFYEVFINPVSNEMRLQGLFADVINYSSYLLFSLIIVIYFYFQQKKSNILIQFKPFIIVIYFGIVFIGMWQIKHMTSLAVFLVVIGLFLVHDFRKRIIPIILYSIILFFAASIYGDTFLEEVVNPRMEKEVEIVKGERKKSQAFHGRMSRWEGVWARYTNSSILSKTLGYTYELDRNVYAMVGMNVHNDFLRMLFFIGIIGLTFYIILLLNLIQRFNWLNKPDRFLGSALLISLILFSITTLPTLYVGFLNIYISLFAYLAQPKRVLLKYKND